MQRDRGRAEEPSRGRFVDCAPPIVPAFYGYSL